jgi:hypothetical protein
MRNACKTVLIIAVAILIAALCASSGVAATKYYVVTNDDNPTPDGNTASVFEVNTTNGSLTLVKTLQTNGEGLGGGYFGSTEVAINSNCIFVSDPGTVLGNTPVGDIAAFSATTLTLTGNYSDTRLNGAANGIGLAINPNGQYLYAGYTLSKGIAVWQINSDCSLKLVGGVSVPYSPSGIAVATQGSSQFLVAAYPIYPFNSYVELFSISDGGATLTKSPAGPQVSKGVSNSVDITQDGNVAVFGDINDYAELETWWIGGTSAQCAPASAPCLTGHQNFNNLGTANNSSNILLSPAAWSDPVNGGCIYISNNSALKVTTARFVEGSGPGQVSMTVTHGSPYAIPLGSGANYTASMQTVYSTGTGAGLNIAEFPNFIATVKVNDDCSLGRGTVVTDNSAASLIATTAWPPR